LSADGNVTLDTIERAAHEAVVTGAAGYVDRLEALVAALLASAAGFGPRATDGLVLLRDELTDVRYFAVGRVHLIDDQSRQPICIELIFAPGREAIASGTVRFGRTAMTGAEPRTDKLEKALMAYPRETVAALNWAYVFERSSSRWRLTHGPKDEMPRSRG
jgi:hypothetical protein